jgi:hypothetical protein
MLEIQETIASISWRFLRTNKPSRFIPGIEGFSGSEPTARTSWSYLVMISEFGWGWVSSTAEIVLCSVSMFTTRVFTLTVDELYKKCNRRDQTSFQKNNKNYCDVLLPSMLNMLLRLAGVWTAIWDRKGEAKRQQLITSNTKRPCTLFTKVAYLISIGDFAANKIWHPAWRERYIRLREELRIRKYDGRGRSPPLNMELTPD